jgi:NitT/TauT family transport system substrate-binding protein
LLALALWAGPARADERITLMVGGIDKIIYLPVKLAEHLGYFRSEGLDVRLRSEDSGIQGVDELLVGTSQGVVGFYDHVIYMQSMGKSVV